jgi:hypothetical protein
VTLKYRPALLLVLCLLLCSGAFAAFKDNTPKSAPVAEPVPYEAAQKIFDHRCVECHSCNNAPCQLKLTSFEGLERGASKIELIHQTRLQSIAPTRLGIDARSAEEWHKDKGFFPVADGQTNLLLQMLNRGKQHSPADAPADSQTCPANEAEYKSFASGHPDKLMPYGLPPLTQAEQGMLAGWFKNGQKPAEKPEELPTAQAAAKNAWQELLNQNDPEHSLVARYLYEHLFLASIHFDRNALQFYRLIRSRTACDRPPDEIATRRPSDDPGASFHYCFEPEKETIVEKTHLPYLMDKARLERISGLFFDPQHPWKASHPPAYTSPDKTNPFVVYQDIPVEARYRFLLEDAQYHVATFIKGPVCYGRGAVNSIDEHFYVFFMSPKSEIMVVDPDFAKASENLLVLPYINENTGSLLDNLSLKSLEQSLTARTAYTDGHILGNMYIAARNQYVKLKDARRKADFGRGYNVTDLWDGDRTNSNAILTVFRHDDHSYVLQGLRGGAASSYFVLDYGLFERLVYNLVVGYDVFGNLDHKVHTRVYMGMIRREAEDNFLLFLPPHERERLRGQWYQGPIAKLGEKIFFVPDDSKFPSQVAYRNASGTDRQLVEKIFSQTSTAARGPHDGTLRSEYAPLASIGGRTAIKAPFVNLFPDSSLVLVEDNGGIKDLVTVIRDRAHTALGRFLLESTAMQPQQDRLALVDGLATSYPNLFFDVPENKLPEFRRQMESVRDISSARAFIRSWAVLKSNPDFWAVSDRLHSYLLKQDPVNFGILDYTRYGLWTEDGDWH